MAKNILCDYTGKAVYFTLVAVKRHIQQIKAKDKTRLYFYECKHCKKYHLTKRNMYYPWNR